MPPKKRAYVAKTKGCYECSRRRIHCDRGEPQCKKCTSRGLECSGLGVRHRFENGVASRGNWAGKAGMQTIYEDVMDGVLVRRARRRLLAHQERSDTTQPRAEQQKATPTSSKPYSATRRGPSSDPNRKGPTQGQLVKNKPSHKNPPIENDASALATVDDSIPVDEDVLGIGNEIEPLFFTKPFTEFSIQTLGLSILESVPQSMPSTLPAWKTHMCHLFSQQISIEMVAVDGLHNGWRHLVLPFAQHDELVMNAVLTVSASHVHMNLLGPNSPQFPGDVPDPHELYRHVICGLKQQRELTTCDTTKKQSVLMTILVLIVGTMVTGQSDFPFLFRMLEAAIDAVGGDTVLGSTDSAAFILSQVNKLRVYSAPLLSEETALQIISCPTHASQLLNSLSHKLLLDSESSLVLSFVNDLVQQAINIYLDQFSTSISHDGPPTELEMINSVALVQHFKDTLEAFPAGAPGEQVLIWASFVAASGSMIPEHMDFFESVFLRHYARNGFGNIRRALNYLRKIWARDPGQRWTSLLADAKFLVM